MLERSLHTEKSSNPKLPQVPSALKVSKTHYCLYSILLRGQRWRYVIYLIYWEIEEEILKSRQYSYWLFYLFLYISQPLKLGKMLSVVWSVDYEQKWRESYTILYSASQMVSPLLARVDFWRTAELLGDTLNSVREGNKLLLL